MAFDRDLPSFCVMQIRKSNFTAKSRYLSVVDPGFPIGRRGPIVGLDLRHRHFSVKMYAKTKELGPVGGRAPGTPPRSTNVCAFK